jgi:hypothetical protein
VEPHDRRSAVAVQTKSGKVLCFSFTATTAGGKKRGFETMFGKKK